MIVRNEALRLQRCLDSVRFAAEIIVVDSHSTDETVAIARRNRARVFQREFRGYIDQKNFAISQARAEWILVIDADEVCSENLAAELQKIAASKEPAAHVYAAPRASYYLGRWIRHGGWYPDYNIRFFRRGRVVFQGGRVHETGRTQQKVAKLTGILEHYGYSGLRDHLERINRYSELAAIDRQERGRRSNPAMALLHGAWKFASIYFFRAGFLDGWAGLVMAAMGGIYNFLKYAKLWELHFAAPNYRDGNERAPDAPQ